MSEIVVFFCASVLLLTFGLVFNDFVNNEIATLSKAMRDSFASFLSWLVLLVVSLRVGKSIENLASDPSEPHNSFLRLGEQPRLLSQWFLLRAVVQLFVHFAVAWFLIKQFLWAWDYKTALVAQVLALLVAAFRYQFEKNSLIPTKALEASHATITPLGWRMIQMLHRNRSTKTSLIFSVLFALLCLWCVFQNVPKPAIFLCALSSGFMCSLALCIQIAEDLKHSWIERACGLSHEGFLAIHKKIAFIFAGSLSLATGLCVFALSFFLQHLPFLESLMWSLQIAGICFTPSFLAPQLSMQIDGKRLFVSFISVVLVGLFIATAIFASVFALIILLLVPGFTEPQQSGRFYRA